MEPVKDCFNATGASYLTRHTDDPLGQDLASDLVVVTTRRALCRMAFIAAETAARFVREGIDHDPVAWMMTPRLLFDGESALDACLDQTSFKRAVLLHGLSFGLDAFPHQIDEFMNHEAEFEEDRTSMSALRSSTAGSDL